MRITKKMARELLEVLEEVKEEYFGAERGKYPFTEWEQKRERVRERLNHLPQYVEQAAFQITLQEGPGRPKKVDLYRRAMLFLFVRMLGKSNRNMELLLELLEPLLGFKVNYKYIERLYSDEQVALVLHNLFILLLQEEGISGTFSGDGTGYSVSISKHYRTHPRKKKAYEYTFRMLDLETGMYVGVGYSTHSEMDAFKKALSMLTSYGITIDTVALDKYYSSRKVLTLFDKETSVYVIPKKNISKIGFAWVKILKRISEDPLSFVKKYFMRNLSEAGFSADKRRFGWMIAQKRPDRQEMAMFSIALLHNVFAIRVKMADKQWNIGIACEK